MLQDTRMLPGIMLRGLVVAWTILVTSQFAYTQTPLTLPLAADKALTAKVDQLFVDWDKPNSPGFALGIAREGKLIYQRGYGMANLDEEIPLSTHSVLQAWSMTKTFTTICVAMLLDQGKIALDDPVSKFVPEIPAYKPPIKIRDLIQCTTGLHDYYLTMQLAGWSWRDAWNGHDVLDLLSRRKSLAIKPGERFQYSNTDYFLLGLIVERASGQSLRQFAQQNLFAPLNMKSTYYDDDASAVVKNRAVGYERRPDGRFYRSMIQSTTVGAFDLRTTVEDLFRWDQNFYANRLKEGPHLKAFLSRGHLDNRQVLESYPQETYRGLPRNWYTGGGPGFFAHMLRFPEQKFAVILLCNLAEEKEWHTMTRNIQQIADLYLVDHMKPHPETKSKWDANAKVVKVTDADLRDKAGLFRGPGGLFHKLVVKSDQLWWVNPFQHAYRLLPLGRARYRSMQSKVPCDLEFVKPNPDGPFDVNVTQEGGGGSLWKAVKPATPAPEQLNHYAGTFHCEELNSTYVFSIHDRALVLQINNGSKRRMTPMIRDVFIPTNRLQAEWIFTFVRDEKDAINGFTIDFARAGVRFQKAR